MAMMVGRLSVVRRIGLGGGDATVTTVSDRSGFAERRCGANYNSGIDERQMPPLSGEQGLEGK